MKALFLQYPKCTTCKKALKYLQESNVSYETRHIVEEVPTEAELSEWIQRSGLPLKRFFNTSGLVYKDMGLKDKLPQMSTEEAIKLLSSNGMLIKRPLLILDDQVVVGFKEEAYEAALRQN